MTEQLAPLANFFEESARQPWGEKLTGTALSLPEEYRRIKLKGNLYVEYLQAGTTNTKEGNTPNKNHVVFQVPFDEDFEVKDDGKLVTTLGARISMDLTGEDDLLEGIDKDHVSSFFCLSLDFADLTILGPCSSRAHISTWRRARTTTLAHFMSSSLSTTGGPWLPTRSRTLGEFVDFIAGKNLHKMSFLGYGTAWKGCRDFMCVKFSYSNPTCSADVVLCFSFIHFLCFPSCLVQQHADLPPAASCEQGRGD